MELICFGFWTNTKITVRQLKERIQTKTNVDTDLQRLIYCGRVMNDEHPLSDYSEFILAHKIFNWRFFS